MVAQPQPPQHGGDGRLSHRLRAWLMSSGSGGGGGGGGVVSGAGSGALVAPRPAPRPAPEEWPEESQELHPPLPRPRTPLSADDDLESRDSLESMDDLAPTLPRIPSIPRLPSVKPSISSPATPPAATPPSTIHMESSRLRAAADFAAYLCSRNYMRGPRLDGLTIEQRMRLFSLVGQVYLPALGLAGRMPTPDDVGDTADTIDAAGG